MRKYLSLTKVFMISIIGASTAIKIGGKERKWAGIAVMLLIAACFAPILWIVYEMMGQIFYIFNLLGELPVAIGLVLNIGSIMIFFFSFLAAPALFYFAKDVEFVLPMPVKAEQIIGAKFTVALLFEYLISLALLAVMFVALWGYLPAGVLTFNVIITFLTLPILPLVYSTVMVMLLVRVSRFGRNPDRYTMFISVVGIVIAVGFSMLASQITMIDENALADMLMGEPTTLTTLNTVFLSNGFAARALGADTLFGGALHNQIINLAITAGVILVFFMLALQ